MIDTWFKKDLEKIFNIHQIVVFIDESKEAYLLLDVVKNDYQIFRVTTELEELRAKYEIEKSRQPGSKFLIYTNTAKNKLKFVREYCETNGCIEIKYLQNYVKEKVHKHLNLNLHLDKEELVSAAKVSIGKDRTYWMDLSHKGASEIFDMKKELLPFLDDPNNYLSKYDKNVKEIFFKKVNELIGQTYLDKPAATLATEVVGHLLDGLANNNPVSTLIEVYYNWLDSNSYKKSFGGYLKKYKLAPKSDIFAIHYAHPFISIDELWLSELGKNISDKNYVSTFIPKINQRISYKAVKSLGAGFWIHIKTLLEFDEKNINQLSSFDECVSFYVKHFHKLDNSIRKLYAEFLSKKELIEPIQSYYKNIVVIFLDKWFKYIDKFESNQTGIIQDIIDNNPQRTAIVVGDGVSFEFAQDIIGKVSDDYRLSNKHDYLFAGLPSETAHNMSQLYVNTGEVIPIKQKREAFIVEQNPDKKIGFIYLDSVNELTDKEHYLICSHKDPDKLGETYQQKALKYFDEVAGLYASKIEQLLKNGYQHVYLITDHGFVLTGLLEDSDKIEVQFNGRMQISERFILISQVQTIDKELLVSRKTNYKGFKYCYFARRLGPFKTPGVYGFSHGGLSPQETIIPYLHWTKSSKATEALTVYISNKRELKEVTGDLYAIKLKAESSSNDLFTAERKIILLFFSNGKNINESDIITIEKDKEIKKEYRFASNNEIEVKVLDAISKEQLDKVTIKQSTARDLGGL